MIWLQLVRKRDGNTVIRFCDFVRSQQTMNTDTDPFMPLKHASLVYSPLSVFKPYWKMTPAQNSHSALQYWHDGVSTAVQNGCYNVT